MATNKPWLTTNDCIASIKRRISFPTDQSTFSNEDLIAFLNEELMISQVPSVMMYHESFFVYKVQVPLRENVNRYQIPNRAIGMKLRDVMFEDEQGNLYEMTRVQDGDKAYFQANVGSNAVINKLYIEGNYVVLTPEVQSNPTGNLNFYIFLRPNQLVENDRAAIIQYFNKKLTVSNASLVNGDTITIKGVVFTAGTDFAIGGNSIITATNLTTAINTNGVCIASNGSPSTALISLKFTDRDDPIDSVSVSNSSGLQLNPLYTIEFESVPENIVNSALVDFLQMKPGHQIYKYDVQLGANVISGSTIDFNESDIPDDVVTGDYICLENESIIPYLPPELHIDLVDKACARILSSIGDQQGLAAVNAKIQENERSKGTLIDNRIENAPQKVLNRHSLLRYNRMGWRRRF